MSSTAYQDEVIILKVKDWQTADKYAVCFSRAHGKVAFLAYGARYARTTGGRLVQPFTLLNAQMYSGKTLDTLKTCELISVPKQMDIKQMAYASIIVEVVEALTESHQPHEEVFELLVDAIKALQERTPRLVVLATICKILELTGFIPSYEYCVNCNEISDADALFSVVQGGLICQKCRVGEELHFSFETQLLLKKLLEINFDNPGKFNVRGSELMELEELIYRFIVYQIEKPLKSLKFLAQIGL